MMRGKPSGAVVAMLVAVLAALTSCSSASSNVPGSPTSGATSSRKPSGPCADGRCEIEVAVGDVVTVPDKYGLGPITVTAIAGDTVEMTAPTTGSGFGVSGCAGGGGMSAGSDGTHGGGVTLECAKGPAATINDVMSLTVVDIRGGTAVLRIEPAVD